MTTQRNEIQHVVVFHSRDTLRRASSFDGERALIRAPWNGRPQSVGRLVSLRIEISGEPASRLLIDGARIGPSSDGVQWFLVYGAAVERLRGFMDCAPIWQAPGRARPSSGLELSATMDRVATRWPCSIDILVESRGETGRARVEDISETGFKLAEVSIALRAGDRVRVHVIDDPGRGILVPGRVAWAEGASAGIRTLAVGHDARDFGEWVAEVRAASLSATMPRGYIAL